ncbi:MAG: PDZ domain-containing protein, partial [Phycisphaerae bacterium]|nr:PDZ domain-containing protein [Phycisphaerae bacterium]
VLFAALLFMCVFLIGMDMPAPVIGRVEADGPADRAGLQPGDRVLTINGWRADSFMDIRRAEILSDQLRLTIERDGRELDQTFVLDPERDSALKLQSIGIDPTLTPRIAADGEALDGDQAPRKGDVVVEMNGVPIRDLPDVMIAAMNSDGRPVEMVFERADPDHPGAPPKRITMRQRLSLGVTPAPVNEKDADDAGPDRPRRHVLGLLSRWEVSFTQEGSPAAEAGFEKGDIVVAWGNIASPTYTEITKNISVNANRQVRVLVDRPGVDGPVEIMVTPKRRFQLLGQAPPQVGISFAREDSHPVIADVVPGTPAASLNIPRGATIISVDGHPVGDWLDLVRILKESAGRTVVVAYTAGGQTAAGEMHVPSSIVNEAQLPADADLISIDGEKSVTDADGDILRLPALSALREMLNKKIGKTVTVSYRRKSQPREIIEVPFTVREDNLDPWQMRLMFGYSGGMVDVLMERVDADGNPLRATWMGMKLAYSYVITTYQTLRQVLRANVSVEHVSGPVGIIGQAVEQAKIGFADLLWFLAFLSINLAVLNFLPIPLVDGGVMVFLIIEKVRGTPLSLKTQMIATLAGLSLLIVCFVVVTYQDLMRLFFG